MALIKTKTAAWQEHFSVSALLNPHGNVEKPSKMHGPLTFRIKSSLPPYPPVAHAKLNYNYPYCAYSTLLHNLKPYITRVTSPGTRFCDQKKAFSLQGNESGGGPLYKDIR